MEKNNINIRAIRPKMKVKPKYLNNKYTKKNIFKGKTTVTGI